jgi:hypothetical protein
MQVFLDYCCSKVEFKFILIFGDLKGIGSKTPTVTLPKNPQMHCLIGIFTKENNNGPHSISYKILNI